MPAATPDSATRRRLERIAHHLDPVVLVGEKGISASLVAETGRALANHELIKVRIHSGARAERQALADELADACGAAVIKRIGKVVVLYRKNPEPNEKLSNIVRYSA